MARGLAASFVFVGVLVLAACGGGSDIVSIADEPTPDLEATIAAAVQATLAATEPSPTVEPTLIIPDTQEPTVLPTNTPMPTRTPIPKVTPTIRPTHTLEVQSFRCYTEFSFAFVEGEVKNLTTRRLENVMAVAQWYTSEGTFITSDDALIDFNPILPGQTSPFKTFSTANPAMDNCTLSFKFLFGTTISMREAP